MKKYAETFIEHILECVELIEEYTENKTEDDFFDSIQLQDSVIRRIEIIGEAVKNFFIRNLYPKRESKIHIGCSGWSYEHWIGKFYLPDLILKHMHRKMQWN